MNLAQGNHKLRLKMYMKEKMRFKKIAKMTVTENWDYGLVIYELFIRKSQITTEKCTWKRKSDFKKSLRWP
jgi:hypothetical protein